jgi:hypothetical protein
VSVERFFGSLAAFAGAGGHPVDDRSCLATVPGVAGRLKAAGRNGHTCTREFVVSQIARLGSATALRCGALRSFISGLRFAGDGVMTDRPVAILATVGRGSLIAAGATEQTRNRAPTAD